MNDYRDYALEQSIYLQNKKQYIEGNSTNIQNLLDVLKENNTKIVSKVYEFENIANETISNFNTIVNHAQNFSQFNQIRYGYQISSLVIIPLLTILGLICKIFLIKHLSLTKIDLS